MIVSVFPLSISMQGDVHEGCSKVNRFGYDSKEPTQVIDDSKEPTQVIGDSKESTQVIDDSKEPTRRNQLRSWMPEGTNLS